MEEQMHHVQEAAKLAFAHDFITKFPNGYDTQIGERGSLLSGGQKQRIAIARSIISHPKVLLLDEATSALDPEAECIVQQALDKACEGRTTIIIAHKLATIQKADNIIVMEKGSIVEQGTHQSLIAHGGTYARLVQAQNLAGPENQFEDVSDHSESVGGAEIIPIEPSTTTLTRRETSDQTQADARNGSSGYDQYERRGIIHVIVRLITQTPELTLAYTIVLMTCILAGKC